MKKVTRKKALLKEAVITIAVCLIYFAVRAGLRQASIITVDVSVSPDGQHTLLLQSRDSILRRIQDGGVRRGSTKGRLVLEEGEETIARFDFSLLDNGRAVRPESWSVSWSEGCVTAVLTGSDQADQEVTITMSGEVSSRYLSWDPFEEYVENYLENLMESVPEVPAEEADEALVLEESGYDETYLRIRDGYRAVYEELFRDRGCAFSESFDAKGNLRIILSESDETVEYLMYDRESENGKCGLYVYYTVNKGEDGAWSPDQAKILDIYAWVYDTGEVISSGRTDWADSGNEAYRAATGE
ncbi:MAG TPA: hypothetical protein H9761_19700 [Candidatus Eisenbergiella merdavium]|uniref:Uncharacterized protein n=1 Tax=Candidatus Eisenbergiella merdavium TaxID=2838551 RepID=A0A9D2SRT4_9FIRM|nr:hypothetical protein [Candidatus Eisenbergiella merdavium]